MKCKTKWCRNKASSGYRLCRKCRRRKEIESDPLAYSYRVQKNNARRRGKIFTISKEDWIALWSEQPAKKAQKIKEILNGVGHKSTYTIDRIDPEKGYEKGNCWIVTRIDNSIYRWNPARQEMEYKQLVYVITPNDNDESVPF